MSLFWVMTSVTTVTAQVTTMTTGGSTTTIVVNGKSYSLPKGTKVQITNQGVLVNGTQIEEFDQTGLKTISITINGDVNSVETDGAELTVHGDVTTVSTVSGDVKATTISGSVSTMSGDVTSNEIHGSVKTMSGDIRTKKIIKKATQTGNNNTQTNIFR